MEKAFAYICTSADTSPRNLKRYCRKVYELGYIPICPALSDGQYLSRKDPDEQTELHAIALQKLARCRMLVVCGDDISHEMLAEISLAEKRCIICTTLTGLVRIHQEEEKDNR